MCSPTAGSPTIASPGATRLRIGDLRAGDDADDRPGEIEVRRLIEPGHLGRLAAEQRHLVVAAGALNASDDLARDIGIELADGQIVEEEQRLRVEDEDVVHAVVDEIGADRAVASGLRGDQDLRPDAVRGTNENLLRVTR